MAISAANAHCDKFVSIKTTQPDFLVGGVYFDAEPSGSQSLFNRFDTTFTANVPFGGTSVTTFTVPVQITKLADGVRIEMTQTSFTATAAIAAANTSSQSYALPQRFWPALTQTFLISGVNNSVAYFTYVLTVSTAGVMTLQSGTNFGTGALSNQISGTTLPMYRAAVQ